jgi:hypothetical protein
MTAPKLFITDLPKLHPRYEGEKQIGLDWIKIREEREDRVQLEAARLEE